jgi:3-oxoacyl-[acyl-carrier-protein] synthase-1
LPVYLNDLGLNNALGIDKQSVCANLLANNNHGMRAYEKLYSGKKAYVGEVQANLVSIPAELVVYDCRNNQLIASAYEQIRAHVESCKAKYGSDRVGVILGTSTSGILSSEIGFKQKLQVGDFPENFDYRQQEIGTAAEFLSKYAELMGPAYVISTACSASGKAIAAAARLLEANICDAVIAGGSDSLCELTLNGFDSLDVMADKICTPYSKTRNGINIGEGAALFLMSREPSAIKLIGSGESSDAHHMSAPHPDALGAQQAMQQALTMAGIAARDVGYINLHGTATPQNDKMEGYAIEQIFGHETYCTSTKPLTGHTLGAAGAQDLALCWLLLSDYNPDKMLPRQLSDHQVDPELALIHVLTEPKTWEKPIFMSNSFGFGGSNVSLLIEREE